LRDADGVVLLVVGVGVHLDYLLVGRRPHWHIQLVLLDPSPVPLSTLHIQHGLLEVEGVFGFLAGGVLEVCIEQSVDLYLLRELLAHQAFFDIRIQLVIFNCFESSQEFVVFHPDGLQDPLLEVPFLLVAPVPQIQLLSGLVHRTANSMGFLPVGGGLVGLDLLVLGQQQVKVELLQVGQVPLGHTLRQQPFFLPKWSEEGLRVLFQRC